MHEDVVSGPECDVEWVEIGTDDDQHYLGSNSKYHEGVVHALVDDGELTGFAEDAVEDLADHHSVEIGRATVFDGLGGVADRSVRVWG